MQSLPHNLEGSLRPAAETVKTLIDLRYYPFDTLGVLGKTKANEIARRTLIMKNLTLVTVLASFLSAQPVLHGCGSMFVGGCNGIVVG